MIRGNQLLLALDVLAVWLAPYKMAGRFDTSRFSRSRIEKQLQRYKLAANPNYKNVIGAMYHRYLMPIHFFLFDARKLPAVKFNYHNALSDVMGGELKSMDEVKCLDHLRNFLRAIARDELTEADFR